MRQLTIVLLFLHVAVVGQEKQDHHLVINPRGHMSLIYDMQLDPDNNVVTSSFDKRVYTWDPKKGVIEKEFLGQIGPGSEGMVYTADVSADGKYLAVAGWMGKDDESEDLGDIRIYDYKSGEMRGRLKMHADAVISVRFSPDSKFLVSIDASGFVYSWDMQTRALNLMHEHVNQGATNIATAEDFFVTAHDDGMFYMWQYDKTKPKRKLDIFKNKKMNMIVKSEVEISDDREKIIGLGKELGMVLVMNDRFSLQQHFFTGENDQIICVDMAPSGERLVVGVEMKGKNHVKVYDLIDKEWKVMGSHEFDDLVSNVEFLAENQFAVSAGRLNEIYVMKVKGGELNEARKFGSEGQVYYTASLSKNHLAFANEATLAYGRTPPTRVFDLFNRNELKGNLDFSRFNKPEREVDNWKIWEYDYYRTDYMDPSQVLLIEKDGVVKDSIIFHPWDGNQFYTYALINDDLIVVGGGSGILQVHDRQGNLLSRLVGHQGGLRSVTLSENGKYLVSSAVDMTIRFWDMKTIYEANDQSQVGTVSPTASMFMTADNEWVIWNPEGYFTASKKGAKYVGYHVNYGKSFEAKFYPFDQFDLKYNRPDIIFKELEIADKGIIELYYLAYKKRLKRMGITEEDLEGDIHLPVVKRLKTSRKGDKILLSIEAEDEKYALDRLNVYVNDVPIYGRKGLSIKEGSNTLKKEVDVQLMNGTNKIEVSVLNKKGVESLRQTVFEENPGKEKGSIYLAAIGVSEYQDENYNLQYAAKDAADVVDRMDDQHAYKQVHTKLLTNEKVTRDSILALKAFFQKANTNDVVMSFIAGHGVLDVNLNYYFCTHDMDFQDPENLGVSYAELEVLFDGIKAIRKLLIMDTCHSGELFKDEVEEVAIVDQSEEKITFRSNKGTTAVRTRQGLQKTNEAVREMFNDLNRGTGTTVISSAGGVEYAMESDQWKNGLFTYCFLKGLSNNNADKNEDGQIYLTELQEYIAQKVFVLSKGKQKPTSRFENISLDYRIW